MTFLMASVQKEKGAEFFSRCARDASSLVLEGKLLPPLSSRDVIEISGGPGSGKTEALYHFIVRCIMPDNTWKDRDLGGLNKKVIFIDNDCHFNLFRLIRIIEKRLHLSQPPLKNITMDEISSFIDSRLELLEIIRCSDCSEFVCFLRQLEYLQCQKYILMIDGITTFYWSDKMRSFHSHSKLAEHQSLIIKMIKGISEKGSAIVIVTRREFTGTSGRNLLTFPESWRKMITWRLRLSRLYAALNIMKILVHNLTAERKLVCAIDDSGLKFGF